MPRYSFFLASSLEKVFPRQRPEALAPDAALSTFRGARAAVQLVYRAEDGDPGMPLQRFRVEVSGAPAPAQISAVELLPSDFPCYENSDEHYLSKEPGLFPDLLSPLPDALVTPLPRQYRSLWLSWEIPESAAPGAYHVTVTARALAQEPQPNGVPFESPCPGEAHNCRFTMRVVAARLTPQTLLHTEWFHTDCLAQYYGVEPLGDTYFRIVENFIGSAVRHGVNLLLTPIFTPPLDTAVGAERPTVQLVGVRLTNGGYSFDFSALERWAYICKRQGVENLEMPHLFTQWGASATPKIMAEVDGVERRVFGWDVPAQSPEYRAFLEALLPALRVELTRLGYDDNHVYYHISDEPSQSQLAAYRAAKAQVGRLLDGCRVVDALSSLSFYREGLVSTPVCASDHIQPFLDAQVPDLWVYYCCAQSNLVPNRFYAMDSARNRIMGVLLYLYDLKGFLHWGFNFYNARFSLRQINPYRVTHADYGFPSGDPYLVYPGPDGQPLSSLRAEVQDEALADLRAFRLLEQLAGRGFVEMLIYENAPMRPITFTDYPRGAEYLLDLRERVAGEIEKRL